ncbi:hypothetical protein FY036_07015 [Mesorhizobium microcysteis]|uniref:Uncharacterized protein n=1 Tax=Neoaquamicrobium microcysteis TaxID=2682781 RepID=A0A5D4H0I8_9HYPH|nr:hypothetical protein [Mesorhizobium microcysteis]TYR33792.1 hypothetical protein FY036_07015 [Mesorhizobium microcysteis]
MYDTFLGWALVGGLGGAGYAHSYALQPIYAALHKKSRCRQNMGLRPAPTLKAFLEVDGIGEQDGYHKRIGNTLASIVQAPAPGSGVMFLDYVEVWV